MTTSTIVLGIVLGLAAGVMSGLFGVGGGILFVPTLVALGLGQLEAQATSLLAILPTVAVGAANQRRYGNLRVRTAVFVGVASLAGVEVGARIATSLPEATCAGCSPFSCSRSQRSSCGARLASGRATLIRCLIGSSRGPDDGRQAPDRHPPSPHRLTSLRDE